jgi:L-amino acid N-acyltransferase YncA
MIVRSATTRDAQGVHDVYAHHVLHGDGTFEETPPGVEAIALRIQAVLARGLPYIVAEEEGRIAAFAYAAPFRTRAAYRYTLEDSVYVAADARRRGYGRAVLVPVIDACRELGVHQVLAVIGGSDNAGSIGLHRALGFQDAGVLTGLGYKFGRWLDVVNMLLPLNGGKDAAPQGAGIRLD